MLNPNISLANLWLFLDKLVGEKAWAKLEVETLVMELAEEENLLLAEKIHVIQELALKGLPDSLQVPEFVIWATQVANNEPADFHFVNLPNSLELAWFTKQMEWIYTITRANIEWPREMRDLAGYILNEDGYSLPVSPLEFANPELLQPGQTEEDTELKKKAMTGYIEYMRGVTHA